MVAMRNNLQIFVALVVSALAVSGQNYGDSDYLDARDSNDYLDARDLGLLDYLGRREFEDNELYARDPGLLDYQAPFIRGFADGGDFVLSARDLARIGVRSDEISHVLIARTTPAQLQLQLSLANGKVADKKNAVKKLNGEIAETRDPKAKRGLEVMLASAKEEVKWAEDEVNNLLKRKKEHQPEHLRDGEEY